MPMNFGHLGRMGASGGLQTFNPNATTVTLLAAMSPTPTLSQQRLVDNLIVTLKNGGVYSRLIGLYIPGGGLGAGPALLNWADAGATSLTARNSPSLATAGYSGNGTNSDLLGPLWSVIEAAGYLQNDASAGVWTGTDVINATFPMATDTASMPFLINGPGVSHLGTIRPNSTSGTVNFDGWFNGKQLCAFSRTAAGSYSLFVNNQKTVTTLASTSVPTGTAHLTFLSASGSTFSTKTVTAGWVGKSLSDDQIAILMQAVNTYLNGLSAFDASSWGLDGAWTWFNDPRVLAMPSGNPLIGCVEGSGNVIAGQLQTSNSFLLNRSAIVAALQIDDHNNPGYLIRSSDSRVLAFYSKHGVSDTTYYLATSVNAADNNVTFGVPVNIGTQFSSGGVSTYSYAHPFELTGEAIIIDFFRALSSGGGFYTQHFSTSSDGGANWAAATRLAWDGRPYLIGRQNGSRITLALSTCNPSDGIFAYNNIYCIYRDSAAWFFPDGTSLGAPPFTQAQLVGTSALVYDSQSSGLLAWQWDVIHDSNGRPVICYATFPVTSPVGQDHRYYQARWNGSAWVSTAVCAAGGNLYPPSKQVPVAGAQAYYSGGICSDPLDPNTIYCSRLVDSGGNLVTAAAGTGTPMLYKGVLSGGVFNMTALNIQGFRPYIEPGGARFLYYVSVLDGSYSAYDSFSTAIKSVAIS